MKISPLQLLLHRGDILNMATAEKLSIIAPEFLLSLNITKIKTIKVFLKQLYLF